jgi:hypothetical protein
MNKFLYCQHKWTLSANDSRAGRVYIAQISLHNGFDHNTPDSDITGPRYAKKFQGLKDLTCQDSQNCATTSTESLGCIHLFRPYFFSVKISILSFSKLFLHCSDGPWWIWRTTIDITLHACTVESTCNFRTGMDFSGSHRWTWLERLLSSFDTNWYCSVKVR